MATESWQTEPVEVETDSALVDFRAKIFEAFKNALGIADAKVRRGPNIGVAWTDRFGLENDLCVGAWSPCYNGHRIWFLGINTRPARILTELHDRITPETHARPRCIDWKRGISLMDLEALEVAAWMGKWAGLRGTGAPIPDPPKCVKDSGNLKILLDDKRGEEQIWTGGAIWCQYREDPARPRSTI